MVSFYEHKLGILFTLLSANLKDPTYVYANNLELLLLLKVHQCNIAKVSSRRCSHCRSKEGNKLKSKPNPTRHLDFESFTKRATELSLVTMTVLPSATGD